MNILKKSLLLGLLMVKVASEMWVISAPPANASAFTKGAVSVGDSSIPYRLFSPETQAGKKYPLVVFLHGSGERGEDNENQLRHGLAMMSSAEFQAKEPVFLLAPQCPNGRKWSEVDWSKMESALPAEPSVPMTGVMKMIDSLVVSAPVDPDRIYITGLSMGGYGTWDAISRWADRFAAAVPVCGGGDEKQAARLTGIPIWCFHGDQDKAVPVERSRNMIEAIKGAGGKPNYTEYPGVGHNSWDKAYADPALYKWLFAQRLSQRAR
jgi:predicted peptidase